LLLPNTKEYLDFSSLKATLTAMTIVSSHNTDREAASSWDAKDREARSRETVSQHQTNNSQQQDETFFDANMSSLRPTLLDEYIGQESLKRQIKRAIASAKAREASLEHILLYGPPWLGKTTLAAIVARRDVCSGCLIEWCEHR
jgi:chromosomal replication initiation ATPase DnaA